MASKEQHIQNFISLMRFCDNVSRQDLAETFNLAASAVSTMLKPLFEQGIVSISGTAVSRGGRRVSSLTLHPELLPALGVEVSGRGVRALRIDTLGQVISSRPRCNRPPDPAELAMLIRTIIDEERRDGKLAVVGIALGGPVNLTGTLWRDSGRWEYGRDVSLVDLIASDLPVMLMNDVHAAGLAEARFGVGNPYRVVLYIHAGAGVRLAIIIDKRVYTGAHGAAGELGHTRSTDSRNLCYCGNYGCIETVSSIPAVLEQIASARSRAASGTSEAANVDGLISKANDGDKLAFNTLTRAAEEIGKAAGDAATLFDPDAIVLGGRLVAEVETFRRTLERVLRSRLLPIIRDDMKTLVGVLGEDAAGVGAALAAQDRELVDKGLLPAGWPRRSPV